MPEVRINSERLLADLDRLRDFGRTGTGVVRPAFTEPEVETRKWVAQRMRDAGLKTHLDPVGNLFGLPPGDEPCLLTGSHTDSQPEGGWLDGAYGVIAALEAARACKEAGGPSVAVVSFQDEEGRFGVLTGSQVWSGDLDLATADAYCDADGVSLKDARASIADIASTDFVPYSRFTGFIESHIEQGPNLDNAGEAAAAVEAIVGKRELYISFSGETNHAGTTPMAVRRDAVKGLAAYSQSLDDRMRNIVQPSSVWTIGHVTVGPNASSIVPGEIRFSVQWRDAETDRLDRMEKVVRAVAEESAEQQGLELQIDNYQTLPPVQLDTKLVQHITDAAKQHAPGRWRRMTSGALHDATNVSAVMPTAMMFVPSIGGISHSFKEDTKREDLVTGAQILASAVAAAAS